jgi:hypothetical protein
VAQTCWISQYQLIVYSDNEESLSQNHHTMKYSKLILTVLFSSFLAACGGGGGGSTPAATAPVASASTFPIKTILANMSKAGSYPFTLSGFASGVALTGSGTITNGSQTAATFEGVPALQQTITITGTGFKNGVSIPLSGTGTGYSDSNYLPIGYSGNEYIVYVNTNLPSTLQVNDAGTIFNGTRYTSSSKTTSTGTETETYAVQPDTATTAILVLTSVQKNTGGVVTQSTTEKIRITTAGDVTRLSISLVLPNGDSNVYTF